MGAEAEGGTEVATDSGFAGGKMRSLYVIAIGFFVLQFANATDLKVDLIFDSSTVSQSDFDVFKSRFNQLHCAGPVHGKSIQTLSIQPLNESGQQVDRMRVDGKQVAVKSIKNPSFVTSIGADIGPASVYMSLIHAIPNLLGGDPQYLVSTYFTGQNVFIRNVSWTSGVGANLICE